MSAQNIRYKYCIVPKCTNTVITTPNKVFISVPKGEKIRKQWCNAMKRDNKINKVLSSTCNRFCCEDHFELGTDMENYMKWKMMGGNVRLRKGVLPHIFKCQQSGYESIKPERGAAAKKRRIEILQNIESSNLTHTSKSVKWVDCGSGSGDTLKLFEDGPSLVPNNNHMRHTKIQKSNGIGRDTRFKGQKRVAVDFELKDDPLTSTPKPQQPLPTENRRRSSSSESISIKRETEPEPEKETNTDVLPDNDAPLSSSSIINIDNLNEDDNFIGHEVLDDQEQGEHLSVWAKKERKFKCDLCPSSFKRASHLSRHQLVHTGERPFACDQCDKAFSRHDKLKHHVHKAHEIGALNEALGPDSLYTIDHVDILTPETNMVESSSISFLTQEHSKQNVSTLSSASVSSMDFGEPLQKKARGRPRKYPAVPKPLIKRPRGRPRINPAGSFGHGHGYQSFQRDSFGEMNYHYKYDNTSNFNSQDMTDNSELENDSSDLHEQGFMEPLVEIKTELAEKLTDQEEEEQQQNDDANFFQRIGLFENNSAAIAKIGECTISMAASCSNNTSSNNTSNNNNTNNTEVVDN
ncbi:unnamed protein product [Psylliodes chrysocephalus]|uniref:Uncharacterized protein n=1 Tax=Psylliodes chrysocephalus TaxID=3402493 RepID=A0A9P0D0Y1_9CUCU|nr:unnamed protein product [Psylliodes chrysocephala]